MFQPAPRLSRHFTLYEMTYSDTALAEGIDNAPDDAALRELQLLTRRTLEPVRLLLGALPILINSGYRCPELNEAVGGATNSAHLSGAAADIVCPEFGTPLEICRLLEPYLRGLQIDQLIHENDAWVHIGRAVEGAIPRCECLTIDNGMTVSGIV